MRNLAHMVETELLTRFSQQVADVDVGSVGADELGGLVREFAADRAGLDATEARWLGELETRGVCDRFGSKTGSRSGTASRWRVTRWRRVRSRSIMSGRSSRSRTRGSSTRSLTCKGC
jgi:hypothetical protein